MGAYVNVLKVIFLTCLFNQIYCFSYGRYPCPTRTLRCNNGQFVATGELCDDTQDCTDGSDEPSSCKTWNCGPGQFSCIPYSNSTTNATATATCLNAKVLCDTRKDCANNFDEENCGDLINVQNCQIGDGKFLCKDKSRCLGIEYTCDAVCQCLDCSDENDNCTKIDYQPLNRCPHAYYPLPLSSGAICLCNSSSGVSQNLCKEVKDCTSESRCDQRCSKYKNRILCSCFEDYVEVAVSNGFKCRSKQHYGTRLIYSTSNQIKSLNATTKRTIVIKKDVQTQVLAAALDTVYYTTYRDMSKSIYRISKDTYSAQKMLDSNSPIVSIAVDYITENVYFTSNGSLSVCSKKGEICLQLICCNVSYVVLNPKNGTMFYTKLADKPNERFLMRANMDGSRETIYVDGSFPDITPIAVDEEFYRLYWLEGNKIHSISLHDKTIKKREVQFNHALDKSLSVLDGIMFYATQRENKIYQEENLERFVKSADKKRDEYFDYYEYERRLEDSNYTLHTDTESTISIVDVKAYNYVRQLAAKAKNPCGSSCSGICLLRAPRYTALYGSVLTTCTCDDFSPSEDNHWCGPSSLQINPTPNDGDDDGFPFMMTLLILVVLAAILGGMYFIYDKYYRGVFYNSSRSQDDRIFDPNRDEL
ncbi:low-density lipoprotein receptor-related protein 2-like [Planococcus citri]|uniref:low-density lipoprotein receptor-related protein 2-like n=1 Tax=Planococcus citri TaxID=170843 RepID=UPI0031FA41D5